MKILLIIAIFTSSCQHGINGIIEKGKNWNKVDGSRKLPGGVDDVMQVSWSAEEDFPDVMFVQTKSSFPRIPGVLQTAGHFIRDAAEVIKHDAKAKLEQIQTHLSNAMPAAPEPAFAGEANNFKSDPSFRRKMMSKSESDEARVVARKEMASDGENSGVKKESESGVKKGGESGVKKGGEDGSKSQSVGKEEEGVAKDQPVMSEQEYKSLVSDANAMFESRLIKGAPLTMADRDLMARAARAILEKQATTAAAKIIERV